ncbi:cation-transporting P-type ATPase, partial [Mycobacterium sp.]|uniref:cation-transporting P-type ATPase n=1 Tax=Mycobacterium sp. TaxID=1785 RepID=UPI002CA276B4
MGGHGCARGGAGAAGQLDRRLSSTEAAARLQRYGPNALRTHRVNALAVLGRQLRS